jgi:uncharacterized membrane protein YphA (DoxX/SURF4 family)
MEKRLQAALSWSRHANYPARLTALEEAMLVLGRSVFAIATIGFGALSIIYRDFVHNLQPVDLLLPASTVGYVPLAILSGAFLIACGTLIFLQIRSAHAAMALAIFFAIWVVFLQLPTAFLYPRLLRSPWWVRTFEVVAMTGTALIIGGLASRPVRDQWIARGRVLFGLSLPVFGVLHLVYGPGTASLIPAFYPFPLFLAYFTGTAKIAAGLAIASGRLVRVAAMLTALQYAVYTLTLHLPRQFIGRPPDAQRAGSTSLFVAVAFCGAALVVAGTLQNRARDRAREHAREDARERAMAHPTTS